LNLDHGRNVIVSASTGLSVAVFSLARGVAGTFSPRARGWPVFALVIATAVFLMYTVNLWWEFFEASTRFLPVALVSVSLLPTFGVLAYLLYAERPPGFWTGRDASSTKS
jgi:uncharacterized membrane protein